MKRCSSHSERLLMTHVCTSSDIRGGGGWGGVQEVGVDTESKKHSTSRQWLHHFLELHRVVLDVSGMLAPLKQILCSLNGPLGRSVLWHIQGFWQDNECFCKCTEKIGKERMRKMNKRHGSSCFQSTHASGCVLALKGWTSGTQRRLQCVQFYRIV